MTSSSKQQQAAAASSSKQQQAAASSSKQLRAARYLHIALRAGAAQIGRDSITSL